MRQPKALSLLFLVQMWECFSFFGMRALLVLYMIEGLHFTEVQSFGVYAIYTAMVEVCVLMGGFLADKVWGLRRCIFLGGSLITVGHLCLALTDDFFFGLAFIIVGSSLFKSNVKALLGAFYGEDDPRREAGFTLFYSGMNLGGLLAALGCGYAAHLFGWHVGFGLAALGMILGLLLLIAKRKVLEDKGRPTVVRPLWIRSAALLFVLGLVPLFAVLLQQCDLTKYILFMMGAAFVIYLFKKTTPLLMGLIFLVMVYFAFEELMGSLLMVYSNKYVATSIPATVLIVMNPLVIILLGPIIAKFRTNRKTIYAFVCLASAFFLLFVGAQSVVFLLASFAAIALGELLLAPTVYAESTKAPENLRGVTTSLVTMGFAYGSLLSGTASQWIAPQTLADYGNFFFYATLVILLIVAGLCGVRKLTSLGRMRGSSP